MLKVRRYRKDLRSSWEIVGTHLWVSEISYERSRFNPNRRKEPVWIVLARSEEDRPYHSVRSWIEKYSLNKRDFKLRRDALAFVEMISQIDPPPTS